MEVVIAILMSVIPLVVLLAIPTTIVAYLRRRKRAPESPDPGLAVRQLFGFAFLYVLLCIAGTGVAGLLSELFEFLDGAAPDETGEVALWWTFAVVGIPLLILHAYFLHRRVLQNIDEATRIIWWLYLSVVDLSALAIGIVALIRMLSWPIEGETFDPTAAAILATVVTAWMVHWRIAGRPRDGKPLRRQVNMLSGSVVGMVGLAVSFVLALGHLLNWVYDGITPSLSPDILDWVTPEAKFDEVADALSPLLTFGLVWWWYWWRHARLTGSSVLRHGYVSVVGVLGGFGATVAAISGLSYISLSWVFIDSGDIPASKHFAPLPEVVALLFVGIGVWSYHRRELPVVGARTEVERSYDYLSAWVGLAATTVGVYVLLAEVVFSRVLAPSSRDMGDGHGLVLLSVLLTVGGIVWWRSWFRIGSQVDEGLELASPTRRIYLSVVFGGTTLAVMVGLLFLVFNLVYGLLERDLNSDRVADMRIPLAVIGSTIGTATYHRRFFRQARAVRGRRQLQEAEVGFVRTHGLSHISLSVEDPEASLAFYKDLFGVREYFRDEKTIQVLGPGEHDVIVFEHGGDHGASGGISHFGFRLTSPEDINLAIRVAESAGATIISHGERGPSQPYLYLLDPDGYRVEVWYEEPRSVE